MNRPRCDRRVPRTADHRAAAPGAQRGFAIVGAFFLVAILAALGLYLSRITAQNQAGSALDISGARAYQAARAGVEWAAFQVLSPATAPACPATTTLALPADSALAPFTVTITCSMVLLAEAGSDIRHYQFTARACAPGPCTSAQPPAGYVDRQVEATLVRR
jgi:MSHA biogenesis protein MshP